MEHEFEYYTSAALVHLARFKEAHEVLQKMPAFNGWMAEAYGALPQVWPHEPKVTPGNEVCSVCGYLVYNKVHSRELRYQGSFT